MVSEVVHEDAEAILAQQVRHELLAVLVGVGGKAVLEDDSWSHCVVIGRRQKPTGQADTRCRWVADWVLARAVRHKPSSELLIEVAELLHCCRIDAAS